MSIADRLVAAWYAPQLTLLAAALVPLSIVFASAVALRRTLYRGGLLPSERLPVPIVVVGNLTVGGSGKTPLTIALAQALAERGWRPRIVSRGYGGAGRRRGWAGSRSYLHGQGCRSGSAATAPRPCARFLPRMANAMSSSLTT